MSMDAAASGSSDSKMPTDRLTAPHAGAQSHAGTSRCVVPSASSVRKERRAQAIAADLGRLQAAYKRIRELEEELLRSHRPALRRQGRCGLRRPPSALRAEAPAFVPKAHVAQVDVVLSALLSPRTVECGVVSNGVARSGAEPVHDDVLVATHDSVDAVVVSAPWFALPSVGTWLGHRGDPAVATSYGSPLAVVVPDVPVAAVHARRARSAPSRRELFHGGSSGDENPGTLSTARFFADAVGKVGVDFGVSGFSASRRSARARVRAKVAGVKTRNPFEALSHPGLAAALAPSGVRASKKAVNDAQSGGHLRPVPDVPDVIITTALGPFVVSNPITSEVDDGVLLSDAAAAAASERVRIVRQYGFTNISGFPCPFGHEMRVFTCKGRAKCTGCGTQCGGTMIAQCDGVRCTFTYCSACAAASQDNVSKGKGKGQ